MASDRDIDAPGKSPPVGGSPGAPTGDERLADAWGDVPDPLTGPAAPNARPPAAPSVPSPTRGETKVRRLGALVFAVAWGGLVLAFFGTREDLSDDAGFVLAQTLLWVALLGSVLFFSASKGHRGLGPPMGVARALAILAPIAFMVLALAWLPDRAPGGFAALGPVSEIVACFGVGFLVAVPTLALAFAATRRAFPINAGWRAALLGAGSGLVAAIVSTLHCSSRFGGHVALGHGLPIVCGAIVGALLGERLSRA